MALPADYNTGTVTGKYVNLLGVAETGKVTFRARADRMVSDDTDTVVIGVPIVVNLTAGEFTVNLPATDDPDIFPTDFTYEVTEELSGGYIKRYDIVVEQGTTLDLSSVIVPSDPSGGSVILPENSSRAGALAVEGSVTTVSSQAYSTFDLTNQLIENFLCWPEAWEDRILLDVPTAASGVTSFRVALVGVPPEALVYYRAGGSPVAVPHSAWIYTDGSDTGSESTLTTTFSVLDATPVGGALGWDMQPVGPSLNHPLHDMIKVPGTNNLFQVPEVGGRLACSVLVVQAGMGEPVIAVPRSQTHGGEKLTILSADGAPTFSLVEVDEDPSTGMAAIGELFVPLLTAIGEGNSIDLTSATVTTNVDGTLEESDPIGDSFGPMISGDGYAELQRLLGVLVGIFLMRGCSIDGGTGVISSPTSGAGSVVQFDDPTTMAGINLFDVWESSVIRGLNGFIRTVDRFDGGLGASAYFPYDEWDWSYTSPGTHTAPNTTPPNRKAVTIWCLGTGMNGTGSKWTAEIMPLRDSHIGIAGWNAVVKNPTNSNAAFSTLNDLDRFLLNVGGLSDGAYQLVLTRDSGGDNTLTWEPIP